jgi:dipeptidyl aminopeptidase/acylaminoacyl peptidase
VSLATNLWVVAAILGGIASPGGQRPATEKTAASRPRPVTVADAITMTRIAGNANPAAHPKSGFAVFSPNGKYFAFVVTKGNLERNANDYSLLLFRSSNVSYGAVQRTLVTFSSSSNRAGISEVQWLDDNDTIFFLGSHGTEPTQLYSIRCSSRKLTKLTSHPTSLLSYAISEKANQIAYAAETPKRDILDENTLRYGFEVSSERLGDLVLGQISRYEPELFLKRTGRLADKPLRTEDPFDSGLNDLDLSPDGRYLILKTDTVTLPENWRQYDDENIQTVLRRKLIAGHPTRILHYELINVRTGRSEALLNAPASYSSSDVLWSPDSKSLLLCGTYLPLDAVDPAELHARRTSKFVVEIELASREITKITKEDLRPNYWDPQTNTVQFTEETSLGQAALPRGVVYYRKARGSWTRLAAAPKSAEQERPQVLVDEDLNRPPRVVAVDPQTGRQTLLLDLNPQFAQLAFGKEEEIHWTTNGGAAVDAGMYLPPDYSPGKKYPLVIQTHGFDPHGFWIDGSHTSAFAAQPLASRGIVVLQMNDIFFDTLETTRELERVRSAYESAIDYLDEKGIIDRNRVGLVGFSRTCMYVKYALTHSVDHFAAALVTDGVDAGYFQYLLFYNADPSLASGFDNVIGGPPFGDGMASWLKNSPGFSLDRVQTPLQIQAIGPESVLGEWQWFEGLRRLGKPVDMVYLPGGTHVLVKAWDRMVSQGGTVDWFCFWLKGEEDPDPAKTEQYIRWRELRKIQEQNQSNPPTN